MPLKTLQKKIGVMPDGVFGPKTLVAAAKYFVLSPERAAHFFGQVAHETGNLTTFTENLNYSAKGLLRTFPKYFKTLDQATEYAFNPVKIASKVYGNRNGNGNEHSQDGWKFRGRGGLQLTFFNNYKAFSEYIKRPDILDNPEIVADELAFESALFYFDKNNLWLLCDKGVTEQDIRAVTRRVNGGENGLQDRIRKTQSYYSTLKKSWDIEKNKYI